MTISVAAPTYGPVPPGDKRFVTAKVTLDASYPTGGYPLVASTFGLTAIVDVLIGDVVGIVSTSAAAGEYVPSTGKLKLYVAAGTETPNATNLSAGAVTLLVIGY